MMNKLRALTAAFSLGATLQLHAEKGAVHMANGIKIGEVTQTSAIIWTRLTIRADHNFDGTPFPDDENRERRSLPVEDLDSMQGSAPGTAGEVRVTYWPVGNEDGMKSLEWEAVDVDRDFTRQFALTELLPGQRYALKVEGRASGAGDSACAVDGEFVTAPADDREAVVSFTVVTGQDYLKRDDPKGHKIYPQMQKLKPDFFVHTGDILYYDRQSPYADNETLARFKWNRTYSLPLQRDFHNRTASYFIKDDHDTLKDDCWPTQKYGDLTWEQGLAIFREQVPMGEKTFRTIRWGKDLQIWLVEGRDFRSPNKMPNGPEKTIWGKEQKQWFFDSVKASDATFRILISPTPIVGPDRKTKNDNHSNDGFSHEGDEIRTFISEQDNMYVVCGDRHWQYVSVDPKTGVKEYSCGPTCDAHAGGFSEKNKSPMHQYLKVVGGFLRVVVERVDGEPHVRFQHYGVDGGINNEDVVELK